MSDNERYSDNEYRARAEWECISPQKNDKKLCRRAMSVDILSTTAQLSEQVEQRIHNKSMYLGRRTCSKLWASTSSTVDEFCWYRGEIF